jgi:hypothetical protein
VGSDEPCREPRRRVGIGAARPRDRDRLVFALPVLLLAGLPLAAILTTLGTTGS